jgi:alpha-L-rhamnosidase
MIEGESLVWEITVPANTTATAYIPAQAKAQIYEGDAPIEESFGVEFITKTPEAAVVELQSGSYRFKVINDYRTR